MRSPVRNHSFYSVFFWKSVQSCSLRLSLPFLTHLVPRFLARKGTNSLLSQTLVADVCFWIMSQLWSRSPVAAGVPVALGVTALWQRHVGQPCEQPSTVWRPMSFSCEKEHPGTPLVLASMNQHCRNRGTGPKEQVLSPINTITSIIKKEARYHLLN